MQQSTASKARDARWRIPLGGPVVLGLTTLWLAIWMRAVLSGSISWHWIVGLALINGLTLLLYFVDKKAAQHGRWRVSEERLHTLELLGGWPSAYLAQALFRHKTQKTGFLVSYWLCALLNFGGTCAVFWLLWRR